MPGDDKYIHEMNSQESIAANDILAIEDYNVGTELRQISVLQLQNYILGNADPLNTDIPLMADFNFAYSEGTITWDTGTILYAGVTYEIETGYTDKLYIYWDEGNPSTFTYSDVKVNTKWLMCYRDAAEETVYPAFQQKIIHGAFIKALTIEADHINLYGIDENGRLDLSEVGTGIIEDINGDYKIYISDTAPGSDIEGLVGRWSLAATNFKT